MSETVEAEYPFVTRAANARNGVIIFGTLTLVFLVIAYLQRNAGDVAAGGVFVMGPAAFLWLTLAVIFACGTVWAALPLFAGKKAPSRLAFTREGLLIPKGPISTQERLIPYSQITAITPAAGVPNVFIIRFGKTRQFFLGPGRVGSEKNVAEIRALLRKKTGK